MIFITFFSDFETSCNHLVMYANNSTYYSKAVEPVLLAIKTSLLSSKIQLQLQLGPSIFHRYQIKGQCFCYLFVNVFLDKSKIGLINEFALPFLMSLFQEFTTLLENKGHFESICLLFRYGRLFMWCHQFKYVLHAS